MSQVSSPLSSANFEVEPWGQCPINYPLCKRGTLTTVTDIVEGGTRSTRYYYNPRKQLVKVEDPLGDSTY